jgi:hypothetical protein
VEHFGCRDAIAGIQVVETIDGHGRTAGTHSTQGASYRGNDIRKILTACGNVPLIRKRSRRRACKRPALPTGRLRPKWEAPHRAYRMRGFGEPPAGSVDAAGRSDRLNTASLSWVPLSHQKGGRLVLDSGMPTVSRAIDSGRFGV